MKWETERTENDAKVIYAALGAKPVKFESYGYKTKDKRRPDFKLLADETYLLVTLYQDEDDSGKTKDPILFSKNKYNEDDLCNLSKKIWNTIERSMEKMTTEKSNHLCIFIRHEYMSDGILFLKDKSKFFGICPKNNRLMVESQFSNKYTKNKEKDMIFYLSERAFNRSNAKPHFGKLLSIHFVGVNNYLDPVISLLISQSKLNIFSYNWQEGKMYEDEVFEKIELQRKNIEEEYETYYKPWAKVRKI